MQAILITNPLLQSFSTKTLIDITSVDLILGLNP